jgi:YbbR domain-containing protein
LKVAAFGVGLLLWVAVRAEAPNSQAVPGVPVRVDVTDPSWALVQDPMPSTVTVRFGGPSGELIRMGWDRPAVVIPLDEVVTGDTVVLLRTSWVQVQDRQGVTVENIEPSSVRLSLEAVERATLAPAIQILGELGDDLALSADPWADPAEIRVIGPRSRVEALRSVPLLPLDLTGISASGRVTVAVDTASHPGLQFQPSMVQIQVEVADRVESVVSGVPVVLPPALRANRALQVRPGTESVLLQGARPLMERLDRSALELVVQLDPEEVPPVGTEDEFPLAVTGLPALVIGTSRSGTAVVRNGGEPPP